MRKEMFDELLESVQEMKAIQSGRRRPARVTRTADLVSGDAQAQEAPVDANGGLTPR